MSAAIARSCPGSMAPRRWLPPRVPVVAVLLVFVALFGQTGTGWAADPTGGAAGAVLERDAQLRRQRLLQQRLEERDRREPEEPVTDKTAVPPPAAPAGDVSFHVSRIEVGESAILDQASIRRIVAPLEGRRVALQELFDAVEAINRLYAEQQAVAARAILPPQKVSGGVVTIRLVEGRVGVIELSDNRDTDERFIRERLSSQPGDLVRIGSLEQDLFFFNTVNDVQLRAVLKPGEAAGTTDYLISVLEPERHQYHFFLDNAGTRDVGRERIGVSYLDRSLTGVRDSLSLGGSLAEGTRSAYVAYSRPVTTGGTRLAFSLDYSEIDIVDGALEPLNVSGDSYNLGLFATHPLRVTRAVLINGFAGLNVKESTTDFDDVTLFETRVRTVSLGFDAQAFGADSSWYTRHFLTAAREGWGNDRNFLNYNGEGSWLRLLPGGDTLLLRGRAQLSNKDLLPTSEQFQVGGMSSVRGYPEGLLIGDEGYFVSIEYARTLRRDDGTGPDMASHQPLRGFVFFDHGAAFPFKGDDEDVDRDDFLTSAGFGINIDLGRQFRGRLVAGFPLFTRDDGKDDPSVHFYVQSTPF